jgi:hypothetical protein
MYSHGLRVSDASFSWTHTGMPSSTLARSAKPMWSKWACVSTSASTSPGERPIPRRASKQGLPGGRQAGVDDGDPAPLLYEVPVYVVLADPVNALGYVAVQHRCLLRQWTFLGDSSCDR